MADGGEPRSQRPLAMTERARVYFSEKLPTLAASSQPVTIGEEPNMSETRLKRSIKLTEKGADEFAGRMAQREQHEKNEQRAKRKAEAEARGNASQPSPLGPEPKRQKITLKRPQDILDIPYDRLFNEEGRIKWLRQALIRRDGQDPYEPGMESAELKEIYDEVPDADSEVQCPPPIDVTIGKTIVKKSGNKLAPLRATDHTTIGIGGAPNYVELPRGRNGKPVGPIEPEEPPIRLQPSVLPPTTHGSHIKTPGSSTRPCPSSSGPSRRSIPGSSTVSASRATPHSAGPGMKPQESVSKLRTPALAHQTPRASHLSASGSIPPNRIDQDCSACALPNSAAIVPATTFQTSDTQPARPTRSQPPTPPAQSRPKQQVQISAQQQGLDDARESSVDIPVAVHDAPSSGTKRETKRSEAQLHRFGIARPLVVRLCERIRVRFATVSPFADMVAALDDSSDSDSDSDANENDCSRTLLDDWLAEEWPRVNRAECPGQPMLALEDRYRRYVRAQFCRWRNDAKALISPKIESVYRFVPDIKCQQNVDLVKRLDPDRFHSPNLERDKERFQHPLIGHGIKKSYFSSPNGLGFKYKRQFRSMPLALIAFFCCIICHCLCEYETGIYSMKHLNSQDLLEYWRMYMDVLKDMAQPGHEPNRLQHYRRRLFLRCHGPETKEKKIPNVVPTPVVWQTDSESEDNEETRVQRVIKPSFNKGKICAQPDSPSPGPSRQAYPDSDMD